MLTVIFHPSLLYGTLSNMIYKRYVFPYINYFHAAYNLLSEQSVYTIKKMDELYFSKPLGYELRIQSLLYNFFAEQLTPLQDTLKSSSSIRTEDLSRMDDLLNILHTQYDRQNNVAIFRGLSCFTKPEIAAGILAQYRSDFLYGWF